MAKNVYEEIMSKIDSKDKLPLLVGEIIKHWEHSARTPSVARAAIGPVKALIEAYQDNDMILPENASDMFRTILTISYMVDVA